jgi:N-methylhydantoinase A
VRQGVRELLSAAAIPPGAVDHVVHGTTLLANALIERKGARTALLTTEGFRDVLEIAREHRYDMYDLFLELAQPLVPRHLRCEVRERVLEDGTVLTPLDLEGATPVIEALKARGVEAVAVSLLHSYRNPDHEVALGGLIRQVWPGVHLSLSSEVVPEIREYERASTTVANAYVKGLAQDYLRQMERHLCEDRIPDRLFIMQSSGGICGVDEACRVPIRLLESGPAAGALAAARFGRAMDRPHLLSFDMGGTTAKACLIEGGEPRIAPDFEVARVHRFKRGSGLPVKVSAIEMIEVGAGGGSIARVDRLGLLKVGPDSAGADPGPVCYDRGGTQPTVTDADVVLGYLDPDYFLGGRMRLNRDKAEAAIALYVARPLGVSTMQAAWGIHQVVNETMASAARIHAVERGRDPRDFPLFAFGGAGPVHAGRVAEILRSPAVVSPVGAGITSTVGFLSAPLAFDFVRSHYGRLEATDWKRVTALFAEMEAEGRSRLHGAVPDRAIRFRRACDMRFRGQGHELRIPVPGGDLNPRSAARMRAAFQTVYWRVYGQIPSGVPVEVLSWRLVASGPRPRFHLPCPSQRGPRPVQEALKGRRPAYFPEYGGYRPTPVYDRYALGPGCRIPGPAILEEREATLVVDPRARVAIDQHLNAVVEWRRRRRTRNQAPTSPQGPRRRAT